MFVLARAVTGGLVPALLAGMLFGFYPYRISTYSHLEMQGVFLMPLALCFLLRALEAGRVRHGVALGLAVALEALWSLYLGAYLACRSGVGRASSAGAPAISRSGRAGARSRAAALVAAAIVWPYSRPYWTARDAVGERPRDETRAFSAEPSDFFSLNEMNGCMDRRSDRTSTRNGSCSRRAAHALAPVALVPPLTPMAAGRRRGALVAFDASLGLNGAAFTWLYESPAFRAFRVPARFGMLVGLFLTLLGGLGLARLLPLAGPWTRGRRRALVGFASFELRPAAHAVPATPTARPPIYAALPEDGSVIVDLPLPAEDGEYWIDPTYCTTRRFTGRGCSTATAASRRPGIPV